MFERVSHNGKFLFDKETAYRRFHESVFDDSRGGSVRTVSRSERVVDVNIAKRRKFTAEFFVSSLFARVETKVFEKYAFAVFQSGDFSLSVGAYDIGSESNLSVQKFVKSCGDGSEREFFKITLFRLFEISRFGSRSFFFGKSLDRFLLFLVKTEAFGEYIVGFAHVRAKNNLRAVFHKIFYGGKRAVDSVFVGYNAVFHGNVKIASD